MGEGIIEATITQILKSVGASVEQDETIFEIATDKVDSEITAPESGVITEILVQEGDVVKIGSLLAMLQTEGEEEDNATNRRRRRRYQSNGCRDRNSKN